MKKMLAMLAMGAALCGAAEYRIEATAMEKEGDGWNIHCEGTKGQMYRTNAKNIKLSGTYTIAPGKYLVWVRTMTNNEGYRKCQIKINGTSFGKFGDEKITGYTKPVLRWKKAVLPVTIEADKPMKVEVIALSPYAGIDCIVLSDNPEFKPSDANAEIEEIEEAESME